MDNVIDSDDNNNNNQEPNCFNMFVTVLCMCDVSETSLGGCLFCMT